MQLHHCYYATIKRIVPVQDEEIILPAICHAAHNNEDCYDDSSLQAATPPLRSSMLDRQINDACHHAGAEKDG